MQKTDVEQKLARTGYVFTDFVYGACVTAPDSKPPANPTNDWESVGGSKALVLCLSFLLLTACTDTPESINPKSQPLLPWKYPDSVEVSAVAIDEVPLDGSVPSPKPNNVSRKWLDKHDYVEVSMELDTSFATDSVASRGTIDMIHEVTQTWARVE